MSGLGTAATTLITTRGLFIADGITSALEFGAGITPWFRLWLGSYTPVLRQGTGGGSRVYEPGEIANLYKPIDPETGKRIEEAEYYVVPRDKEADYFRKTKTVYVRFNFAGKEVERIYAINEDQAKILIEVINFANVTKERVSAAISGIKHVATEAIVKVGKLRVRNKFDK